MPDQCNHKDDSNHACMVEEIKNVFKDDNTAHIIDDHSPLHIKHGYQHFDANDLKTLASSTVPIYYLVLRDIAIEASVTPANVDRVMAVLVKNNLAHAKNQAEIDKFQSQAYFDSEKQKALTQAPLALHALDELKPDSCVDGAAYAKMIIQVEREVKSIGSHASLDTALNKDTSVQTAVIHAPVFDQQTALAMLDAHGVKVAETHELVSPDPKAVALNVVKDMKTNIRAA